MVADTSLVADPSEEAVVFELHLIASYGPSAPNTQNGASDPLPMFRLLIFSWKTHDVLWALTESITVEFFEKAHDNNLDLALTALTLDLNRLISAPTSAAANH